MILNIFDIGLYLFGTLFVCSSVRLLLNWCVFDFRKVYDGGYSGHHWGSGRHSLHHCSCKICWSQQQKVSIDVKLMERPMQGRFRHYPRCAFFFLNPRNHLSLVIHSKTESRINMDACFCSSFITNAIPG